MANNLLKLIVLLLLAAPALGQPQPDQRVLPFVVGCNPDRDGYELIALDPVDASDCTTGGGTAMPHPCICDGTTYTWRPIPTTGGGGSPGGSDGEFQYNGLGSFQGSANLTYDDTGSGTVQVGPSTLLALGTDQTGFAGNLADVINVYLGDAGIVRYQFFANRFSTTAVNGWYFPYASSQDNVATLIPNRSQLQTGIGGSTGNLSFITRGHETLRLESGAVSVSGPRGMIFDGGAGDSDVPVVETTLTAASAFPSATLNLGGASITLTGGDGASGSANDADGGHVVLNGGTGYGTGDDGGVGINIDPPLADLHVYDVGAAEVIVDGSNNQAQITLRPDSSGSGLGTAEDGGIVWSPASVESYRVWWDNDEDHLYLSDDAGTTKSVVFEGDAPASSLVVDTAGNVGIGTSTPTADLHVIGGVCVEATDTGCTVLDGRVEAETVDVASSGDLYMNQGTRLIGRSGRNIKLLEATYWDGLEIYLGSPVWKAFNLKSAFEETHGWFELDLGTADEDSALTDSTLTAASAYANATTNLDGANWQITGGDGASGSASDADGGHVILNGGTGYGTGDDGNVGVKTASPTVDFQVTGKVAINNAALGGRALDVFTGESGGTLAAFQHNGATNGSVGISVASNPMTGTFSAYSVSTSTTGSLQDYMQQNGTGSIVWRGLTLGANDVMSQYGVNGGEQWFFGLDNSEGDAFKISQGGLGAIDPFTIEAGAPDSSLVVSSTGNVGIGTNSPSSALHVEAATAVAQVVATTSAAALRVQGGANADASIALKKATATNWTIHSESDDDSLQIIDGAVSPVVMTIEDGASADSLVIDSGGNTTLGGVLELPAGSVSAPALIFNGDTDTGFYHGASDQIRIGLAAAVNYFWNTAAFYSGNAGGFALAVVAASGTTPNLRPDQDDPNTGIGQAGDDQLSLIAGGVETVRVESGTATIDDVLKISPRSAAPTCGAGDEGLLYTDSDSNELCYCDGSSWTGLKAGGTCA